jgi:TRAP transporter 4TM/12TM fusion protein
LSTKRKQEEGIPEEGIPSPIRDILTEDTESKAGWIRQALSALCAIWVVLHIYVAWFLPFSIDQLIILHVGIAGVIIFTNNFLKRRETNRVTSLVLVLFALLMMLATVYFYADYENMAGRIGSPSLDDVIIGTAWVVLVLLATYLGWGLVIPLLVLLTAIYALFGNYTIGLFFHSGIDFSRFIGYCSTYFMGTLGKLPGFSASLIIHFLLFGALLQAIGGAELIKKIGLLIGSRFKSGAAQTAVIASGMLGMVSGSIPANVAITGAFTIPMMKNQGYKPEYAGAVEAVASSGGQIMPPIMSVVAFLIAGLTGIPYASIVIAAFLPALVYYFSLSFNIVIRTQKMPIRFDDKTVRVEKLDFKRDILKPHGFLVIPIIVLTWRILIGETPSRAVFWGNLSMIVLGLINILLISKGSLKDAIVGYLKKVYQGFTRCGMETAKIAVVLAAVGIVMETFTTTGFGQRLSYYIVTMAAGSNRFLLVCLVAVLVLFFGMGMPSAGAYLISVLLAGPALVKLGFPLLSVHMFVFYFAILSALTPPVSLGVLVAISISKGKFLKTALHSLRLALPGLMMPFFFLYKPVILALGSNPFQAVLFNLLLLIGIGGLGVFFEGYFYGPIPWPLRVIFLVAAAGIFHPNNILSYIGASLIIAVCVFYFLKSKLIRKESTVGSTG